MKQPDKSNLIFGHFVFGSDVPEGTQFRLLFSDKSSQLRTVERAAQLTGVYASQKTAGASIFDCVSREMILGDDYYASIQGFRKVLKDVPFLGFEPLGEICKGVSKQVDGFLHTACVTVVFPD